MNQLNSIYNTSLSLLTDLYQITMAYGYWKQPSREAVFHLFFRKNPFRGGYAIAAGLELVLEFLQDFRFNQEDIDYLATLTGNDGEPLFEPAFLNDLHQLELSVAVDAVPEGTVVFPHEPLLRVKGPILQCQLLETALLNMINFQTLIATKAARICQVAGEDPVLEFGLRRAQGIDGALSASRAAYIGGVSATSNVLAGKLFGIPVRGTHAHSWVMSFEEELAAFQQYAEAMPNNCVFLVDTYDTLEGVKKAIQVGLQLREQGHEMVGVRLDSGDLAMLSIEARRLLDEAGFPQAVIVASNDLDEHLIEKLKKENAQINIWGVGTKMVTAYDQPALGGVYKLGALKDDHGVWKPKIKLSEQLIKVSNPGVLQVRRFMGQDGAVADMIYNELQELPAQPVLKSMSDPAVQIDLNEINDTEDLLQPVFRAGTILGERPGLESIRQRTKRQLNLFSKKVLNNQEPSTYPVGLEQQLHDLKIELTDQVRSCPQQ